MCTFVDGTLGAGGHSAAVLSQHPDMQLLIGIDKDPVAHAIAQRRLEQTKAETRSSVKLQQVLVCFLLVLMHPLYALSTIPNADEFMLCRATSGD